MNLSRILLVNKPEGMTSFAVVAAVKKRVRPKKIGHTGTLDPIATGVLPLCLNSATKIASYITQYEKEYLVEALFGITTDTQDRAGQVLAKTSTADLTKEQLLEKMVAFRGDIQQVPPKFSALKHQGKPLYWYAHRGLEVPIKEARTCHIKTFELLDWESPHAKFNVVCSQGTYVRTIVHDLGQALGVGAHVNNLCRSRVGTFTLQHCLDFSNVTEDQGLEKIEDRLLTVDQALAAMQTLHVQSGSRRKLDQGIPLKQGDWSEAEVSQINPGKPFRVVGESGDLLALARFEEAVRTKASKDEAPGRFHALRVFHRF